ncbi:MAG: hypothetical protein ACYTG0_14555 [Planctomycetota bacterium]
MDLGNAMLGVVAGGLGFVSGGRGELLETAGVGGIEIAELPDSAVGIGQRVDVVYGVVFEDRLGGVARHFVVG